MRLTCDLTVAAMDGDTLTVDATVDEATADYLLDADVVDWTGRSRYHRLGAETQLQDVHIEDDAVTARVSTHDHGRYGLVYGEDDAVGRVYGWNHDEVVQGDALDELVSEMPAERAPEECAALALQPGFYRPSPPGDDGVVQAAAVDAVDDLDTLLARTSWARMLETDLFFRYSEPVTMPEGYHAEIVGTEHPDERHLSSTVIDAGYGQAAGRPVAVEVKSARQKVDGRWPRPLVRFVAATD